jgi:chaperone modulatory protein CbpM
MTEEELLTVVQIDRPTLTVWIESGWLQPTASRSFSDIDVARARLVSDLIGPIGVNAEGIGIILDLLDQMHGLRAVVRTFGRTLDAQPDALRHQFLADARRQAAKAQDL